MKKIIWVSLGSILSIFVVIVFFNSAKGYRGSKETGEILMLIHTE